MYFLMSSSDVGFARLVDRTEQHTASLVEMLNYAVNEHMRYVHAGLTQPGCYFEQSRPLSDTRFTSLATEMSRAVENQTISAADVDYKSSTQHTTHDSCDSMRALLLAALLVAGVESSQAACSVGDTACFCKQLGGEFRPLAAPLGPDACRVSYTHQGLGRYVHVYLPPSYDGVTTYPLWVHLHGVFWTTMGDIGKMVGHAVNGTDVIPKWDHSIELFGDKAIIVYPQSLGDAGTGDEAVDGQGDKYRQFWHIPFWRCSVGICRPPDLDDVGFIEKVLADLPKRLPTTPGKLYLSGESAGGMLVQALLCESAAVSSAITAAVDMLGGIAADYASSPECSTRAVPFLKLHGTADPSITFDRRILVDGVNFLSAIEAAQQRAKHNGCSLSDAGAETTEAKMKCKDFCEESAGKPTAQVCGMLDVGHTTDFPHPGFVFEQSWLFFEQQAKLAQASGKTPVAAAAAVAAAKTTERTTAAVHKRAEEAAFKDAAAAALLVTGPLTLNLTFPGTSVSDFKSRQAGKALAAVSNTAGLPTANITVAYYSALNSRRRTLLQLNVATDAAAAAGASPEGTVASYKLSATMPSELASTVLQAIQDGSLLHSLVSQGLTGLAVPGYEPIAAVAAQDAEDSGRQLQLLQPTTLAGAATAQPEDTDDTAAAGAVFSSSNSVGTQPDGATAAQSGSSSSSSNNNAGAIVGGVVGAFCGAALLVGLVVLAAKKRRASHQLPSSVISSTAECGARSVADSDAGSTISSSTSCGNLKSVDVVMHVIDEEAAAVQVSKSGKH